MAESIFTLEKADGRARAGSIRTAHGEVPTPAFMPVGTRATVKTLDPVEVRKRNYVRSDEMPYETPNGCVYDSGDYEPALRQAMGIAAASHVAANHSLTGAAARLNAVLATVVP